MPNHGARQQNPQRSRTGANRLVKSAHRLTAIPSLASADKDVKPEVEQVEQAEEQRKEPRAQRVRPGQLGSFHSCLKSQAWYPSTGSSADEITYGASLVRGPASSRLPEHHKHRRRPGAQKRRQRGPLPRQRHAYHCQRLHQRRRRRLAP